jgi:hypothetical protein
VETLNTALKAFFILCVCICAVYVHGGVCICPRVCACVCTHCVALKFCKLARFRLRQVAFALKKW